MRRALRLGVAAAAVLAILPVLGDIEKGIALLSAADALPVHGGAVTNGGGGGGNAFDTCALAGGTHTWIDLGACSGVTAPQMQNVFATGGGGLPSGTGPTAMQYAFGGCTLGQVNADRAYICWSSGHNDYNGNEIYAFYLTGTAHILNWARLSNSDTAVLNTTCVSGGTSLLVQPPVHSYNGVQHIGNKLFITPQGCQDHHFYAVDLTTLNPASPGLSSWQQFDNYAQVFGGSSVAINSKIYGVACERCNGAGIEGLTVFDPSQPLGSQTTLFNNGAEGKSNADTMSAVSSTLAVLISDVASASVDNKFWFSLFNLTNGTATDFNTFQGTSNCLNAHRLASAYNPDLNKLVGFCGNSLSLEQYDWTTSPPTASLISGGASGAYPKCNDTTHCTSTPFGGMSEGMFNKLQYYNDGIVAGYLINNDTGADVYFWRES